MLEPTEIKLIAKLLETASNSFATHSCNDFDLSFLTCEEKHEIIKRCLEWDGCPEDYNPSSDYNLWCDWMLMEYMSKRLLELLPKN